MQGLQVSKHLTTHYDRALGRGRAAYDHFQSDQSVANLSYLADALAGYSEAYALADAAVSLVPSREWNRWSDRRSGANRSAATIRTLITRWSTVATVALS